MPQDVTLYTYALSPFGMKVYWALVYKRVPFSLRYVNPRGTPEIAFTGQHMVPVIKAGEDWKLDSTPIIQWLDTLFPQTLLTGGTSEQEVRLSEMDQWMSETLLPAQFRYAVDSENILAMMDTGYKLAKTMSATSVKLPFYTRFMWPLMLRQAPFIRQARDQASAMGTLAAMNKTILETLERFIGSGPFMGDRDAPTLNDVTAYAQIFASLAFRMKARPDFLGSSIVGNWLGAMEECQPVRTTVPNLFPGMPHSVLN